MSKQTEISAKEELIQLAEVYLNADQQEKEARAIKAKFRDPIMQLMSEVVREETPLATKKVVVDKEEMDRVFDGDPRQWAALKYPEWDVIRFNLQNRGADAYEVVLMENPDLTKYEFAVEGYKFGRTITHSSPEIDVEAMRSDKDFKKLGSEAEQLIMTTTVYDIDEKAAANFLLKRPDSAPIFSRYTEPGKVAAKLLPFTKMQEEE